MLKRSRYHIPIVRNTLTLSLGHLFPALVDEMNSAFADFDSASNLDGSGDWRGVVVHRNIMEVVCRMTNRLVVGAAL